MEREMVTTVGGGAGAGSAQCPGCAEEKVGRMLCVCRPILIPRLPSLPCQEGEPHGAERLSAGGRPGV